MAGEGGKVNVVQTLILHPPQDRETAGWATRTQPAGPS